MPDVRLGSKDGPVTRLHQNEDLLAVRTRSGRSVRAGPVAHPDSEPVRDSELIASFPEAGVEVYRVPADGGSGMADRKAALRRSSDVRFAGRVLVDDSGRPVLYTENIFVKFSDGVEESERLEIIRAAGCVVKKRVEYAPGAYFIEAPEGTGQAVFTIAGSLLDDERVEYCHPELIREVRHRAIAPEQWHLATTRVGNVTVTESVNADAAHGQTRGAGVVIAIIDDGVDIDHPEFASPGKIVAPRDATLGSSDPRPKLSRETHGTACAGVACADGNDRASGVAPDAKLMPIRLASGLGSFAEAESFRWAADNGADVISCSWGPRDGDWWNPNDPAHDTVFPLPAMTKLAIDYATESGRAGRGCVICWAAGNGRESVDNDGYAKYERVLAIAACNDRGRRSVYSDEGDAIFCTFPSSDFEFRQIGHPAPLTPGIWTTDLAGIAGKTDGDFRDEFGGTSSACPGVAGIAALVLSRNPELSWQEVRDVIRRSCVRIDPTGGNYDEDGHSKLYGFGRPDAGVAADLAVPTGRERIVVRRETDEPITDLRTTSVSLGVAGPTAASVGVSVDIEHTYIGDLEVVVEGPGGQAVTLHNRTGGATHNLRKTFTEATTPGLRAFADADPSGTWTLRVTDHARQDTGTVKAFEVGMEVRTGAVRSDRNAGTGKKTSRRTSKKKAARSARA